MPACLSLHNMTILKSQGHFCGTFQYEKDVVSSLINAGLTIIVQCGDDKLGQGTLLMIAELIFGDGCSHQEFWVYLQSWAISG